MDEATSQPGNQNLQIGDRIYIRQGTKSISKFVGLAGMVVEVFRLPEGSCMVRIDGDLNNQREWFFYRDEIALGRS